MHGRIVETVVAPVNAVWGLISAFGAIQEWHPQVVRCCVSGSGVGAERKVHFASWWAQERLLTLDANGHNLEYEVTASSRPELVGARSRMHLIALAPDRTQLEWSTQKPGEGTESEVLRASIEAYYRIRVDHLRAALGLQ